MSNWARGLRRIPAVATILCVTLAMPLASAHAQAFNVTKLTNNSASKASFPAMVVDSSGNLNLVWIDSVKGLQFARSTSPASGTSFGTPPITPVTIPNSAPPALPAFQPQIAVYITQPNVIEIAWAANNPASTPAAPLYDVFVSRSNQSGAAGTFISTKIAGPVALFDSPRLAFDFSGKTNVVWGQHDVFIA